MLRTVSIIIGLLAVCALSVPTRAQTVTIDASGDVLLDRAVAKQAQTHGYSYPFAGVKSTFRSADIAFVNLECPLAVHGEKVIKPICFKADPKMAACLVDGGVTIVSCANNHSMDCGRPGLVDTMSTLREKGIRWCGAGDTLDDALKPTIITVRGIRVAFVGFCDFVPEGVFLNDDAPTLAMDDEENVRRAVAAARKQANVVVASFHWGVEFHDRPIDRQRHLAHVAAEAGADLVLGHHPHVTQGLEVVRTGGRTCLIDYSLGNFVFDQHLGWNKDPESTIILHVEVGRDGLRSASFLPVMIHRCAPSIARGDDAVRIDERLERLSAELGTRVVDGKVDLTSSGAK